MPRPWATSSTASSSQPPAVPNEDESEVIGKRRPALIPKPPPTPPPAGLFKQAPHWAVDEARRIKMEMGTARPELHYHGKSATWWTQVGEDKGKQWVWHEGQWWVRLGRPSQTK